MNIVIAFAMANSRRHIK